MKKLFLTLITFLLTIVLNYESIYAVTLSNEDSNSFSDSQEKVNSLNDKEEVNPRKSEEDLFGDEQTFPFVAGLGKNAAH